MSFFTFVLSTINSPSYAEVFSPQNIITIVAVVGTFLSVMISWRKLGEERTMRLAHEADKATKDAVWQAMIQSDLKVLDSKLDSLSGAEKSNTDVLRSVQHSVMSTEHRLAAVERELKTMWMRIDENRSDIKGLMRSDD